MKLAVPIPHLHPQNQHHPLDLRNNRPGFNENWEVILDVVNGAERGEDVGVGISIFNSADPKDNFVLKAAK